MTAPGKRAALVIGNGAYEHAATLENAARDAAVIAETLAGLGFAVLAPGAESAAQGGLGQARMAQAISAFEDGLLTYEPGGAVKADAALLYFAGHGLQVRGENYLLPIDSDIRLESHLQWQAFSLNRLMAMMAARARSSLLFLDACRDNPFSEALTRALGAARGGEAGLAEVGREKMPDGCFIAFATAPGRVAFDGRRGENSPFVAALREHMPVPGRSLHDMMIAVRQDVVRATDNKQRPWSQDDLDAPFYFAPSAPQPLPDPTESAAAQSAAADDRLFAEVERTGTVESYAYYLQEFPNGAHAGVARYRIKRIKDEEEREKQAECARREREQAEARAKAEAAERRRAEDAKREKDEEDREKQAERARREHKEAEARAEAEAAERRRAEDAKREKDEEEREKQAERGRREREQAEARAKAEAAEREAAEREAAKREAAKQEAAAHARRMELEGRVPVHVAAAGGNSGVRWIKTGGGRDLDGIFQDTWMDGRDMRRGPEMVVVPAGSFMMGSSNDEPGRIAEREEQRRVTIARSFAIGKFAVTFEEWDAAFAAGGVSHKPSDHGWGRERRPVIDVSWHDAREYAAWLSKMTGQSYRLPSEAEWEYACRAGTATPFWWGNGITPAQANYDGNYVYSGGGSDGEYRAKTVPVNEFQPNRWGLYQVHGNVWEWCEDCWNESLAGAAPDGSAVTTGDCNFRVLRGGSWFDNPRTLRSASRSRDNPDVRDDYLGFRVGRTLTS